MKSVAWSLAALAAMATLTFGDRARADETVLGSRAANPRARAQELFDSALTDAEAGNFSVACPKFLASQTADPKTSTLLNLANCYEKNGQTASAWGAFREAEGLARKAGRADWETAAHARAEALEPKLVRLSIVVADASRVSGLVVSRDGARLAPGEWGVAIPVDPGEHVVSASAEGHVPWETRAPVGAVVSGSDRSTVEVMVPRLDLVPAPPPPPPVASAPVRASGGSTMKTTGVVVAAVGGAGLVAGGILGLIAKGNYDDARGQCRDGAHGCPAGAVSDADGAYRLATGATVLVIAGAVLLASGAAVYLIAPERSLSQAQGQAKASSSVRLGPDGVAATW